jgi:hypothetical protein
MDGQASDKHNKCDADDDEKAFQTSRNVSWAREPGMRSCACLASGKPRRVEQRCDAACITHNSSHQPPLPLFPLNGIQPSDRDKPIVEELPTRLSAAAAWPLASVAECGPGGWRCATEYHAQLQGTIRKKGAVAARCEWLSPADSWKLPPSLLPISHLGRGAACLRARPGTCFTTLKGCCELPRLLRGSQKVGGVEGQPIGRAKLFAKIRLH